MDFDLDMLANQQAIYKLMQEMDRKLDIVIHQVDHLKECIEVVDDYEENNACNRLEGYEQDA